MAARILFVEDDPEIAESLAQGLREEGMVVEFVSDGHAGADALRTQPWDLVILDWWLPGPDGYTLLKEFRENGHKTPVLFLTARDAIAQRVEGLKAGADDYLCKPFAFDELLARTQALLRRSTGTRWQHHDVVLDVASNQAKRRGHLLTLTYREQLLLQLFMRQPGKILSREHIYRQVWQEPYDGESNTLEVHVMSLRKSLEAHGPRLIHTVRGRGYILGSPALPEDKR